MLSELMLRVLLDEREREVQSHLRVHRLMHRRGTPIRQHRSPQVQPSRHPTAEGRAR